MTGVSEGRTVSQTGGRAQGRCKELLPSGRMQILVWPGRKRVRREAGETGRTPSLKVLLLCSEDRTASEGHKQKDLISGSCFLEGVKQVTTRKGRDKEAEACEFLTFWGCFKTVRGCQRLFRPTNLILVSLERATKSFRNCDFRKYFVRSPEVTGHAAELASAVHGSINRKSPLLPASELPGFI